MDPTENTQSDLSVWLTVDDVETARVAGVRFARALADAPDTVFMIALDEQQDLVRVALLEASASAKSAVLTARAFETGARLEWDRMVPLLQQDAMGNA